MVICCLSALHNISCEEAVCSKLWIVAILICLSEWLSAAEPLCFSLLLHISWISGLRFIHLTSLDSIFTSRCLLCRAWCLPVGNGNVRLYANSACFVFTQQTCFVGWLTELMLSYGHTEFSPEKWLVEAVNVKQHKNFQKIIFIHTYNYFSQYSGKK